MLSTLKTLSTMKTRATSLLGASLVAIAALGIAAPATIDIAHAQSADDGRQFSSATGEKVLEAQNLMTANNPSGANQVLEGILASGGEINPYERAIINQMLGQNYNELKNTSAAIRSFQNAVNSGGLLPNEADNIKVIIAQLLIADGQYRAGAESLENHLRSGGQEKPEYVELLVSAWVGAEDYRRALPWAEKWFNRTANKERKHFDLLNFLYNNLGMQGKQADIVKEMIQKWPEDNTLWNNWASMLANGGREQDAFEVNKMLYLGGALTTEPEIKKVIQYYSFYEMPYQAAQILEREMANGRVQRTPQNLEELSTYYRTAREYKKAIPILEQAAQQGNSAKLYAALGEAYYNEGQCQQSESAFAKAIDRGYDAGKSWMQVANCRYDSTQNAPRLECSDYDFENYETKKSAVKQAISQAPISQIRAQAVQAFNKVPAGSRESRNAKKWIGFVSNEEEAFVNRCLFEINVGRELCYSKIKLAYDNQAFTGGEFVIDDPSCLEYKADYDEKYVTVTSNQ